jgi:hypothetical protein
MQMKCSLSDMENHFGHVFNGIKVTLAASNISSSLFSCWLRRRTIFRTQETIPCFYVPSQPALSHYWPPLNARQQRYHQSISVYTSFALHHRPTALCVFLCCATCAFQPLVYIATDFCRLHVCSLSLWFIHLSCGACLCIDTPQFKHLLSAAAVYSIVSTA